MEFIEVDGHKQPIDVRPERTIGTVEKIIILIAAIAAAAGWGVLALHRGETINSVWLVFAAVGSYIIGYTLYARLIEYKVVKPRNNRATPAEYANDGKDFLPTDRRVLFGHHFAAIAGAGPLVGPVMAAQMGYLPGTLWIVLGVIFAGAVQDYLVLWVSTRRKGRSLGQMISDEMGKVGGAAGILATIAIMIIIIAVLALIVVNALADSPWGVFSITMTIPIALFMGLYLRYIRPGKVTEVSVIGVILLLAAIIGGGYVSGTELGASMFTWSKETLAFAIIGYGLVAAILPVWLLLAPRDYLSTFMKIGVIALLAIAIVIERPEVHMPAVTSFAV
ncbi:carbon starvation CstA family protein, partial [Corynebacterium striatum]